MCIFQPTTYRPPPPTTDRNYWDYWCCLPLHRSWETTAINGISTEQDRTNSIVLLPFVTICYYLVLFDTIWYHLIPFDTTCYHLWLFHAIFYTISPFHYHWFYYHYYLPNILPSRSAFAADVQCAISVVSFFVGKIIKFIWDLFFFFFCYFFFLFCHNKMKIILLFGICYIFYIYYIYYHYSIVLLFSFYFVYFGVLLFDIAVFVLNSHVGIST